MTTDWTAHTSFRRLVSILQRSGSDESVATQAVGWRRMHALCDGVAATLKAHRDELMTTTWTGGTAREVFLDAVNDVVRSFEGAADTSIRYAVGMEQIASALGVAERRMEELKHEYRERRRRYYYEKGLLVAGESDPFAEPPPARGYREESQFDADHGHEFVERARAVMRDLESVTFAESAYRFTIVPSYRGPEAARPYVPMFPGGPGAPAPPGLPFTLPQDTPAPPVQALPPAPPGSGPVLSGGPAVPGPPAVAVPQPASPAPSTPPAGPDAVPVVPTTPAVPRSPANGMTRPVSPSVPPVPSRGGGARAVPPARPAPPVIGGRKAIGEHPTGRSHASGRPAVAGRPRPSTPPPPVHAAQPGHRPRSGATSPVIGRTKPASSRQRRSGRSPSGSGPLDDELWRVDRPPPSVITPPG